MNSSSNRNTSIYTLKKREHQALSPANRRPVSSMG